MAARFLKVTVDDMERHQAVSNVTIHFHDSGVVESVYADVGPNITVPYTGIGVVGVVRKMRWEDGHPGRETPMCFIVEILVVSSITSRGLMNRSIDVSKDISPDRGDPCKVCHWT